MVHNILAKDRFGHISLGAIPFGHNISLKIENVQYLFFQEYGVENCPNIDFVAVKREWPLLAGSAYGREHCTSIVTTWGATACWGVTIPIVQLLAGVQLPIVQLLAGVQLFAMKLPAGM